jgi:hypothetical protein
VIVLQAFKPPSPRVEPPFAGLHPSLLLEMSEMKAENARQDRESEREREREGRDAAINQSELHELTNNERRSLKIQSRNVCVKVRGNRRGY